MLNETFSVIFKHRGIDSEIEKEASILISRFLKWKRAVEAKLQSCFSCVQSWAIKMLYSFLLLDLAPKGILLLSLFVSVSQKRKQKRE